MIDQETLKRLEFDKIIQEIATYSHSEATSEKILATTPFHTLDEIMGTSAQVAEIRSIAALGITLRLQQFEEIRPLLERLRPSGSILTPHELLVFIPPLQLFSALERQISPRSDLPFLKSLQSELSSFPDLLEPLQSSIDNDGSIKDGASSALKEIRRAKRSLAARIRKKIEEIIQANKIEIFLQDDFITQRGGRWVIPVRMDSKGMVKGVVHDVSSSGETAFMEPLEIIPFVNELENLAAEEKSEEIRILRQLSAWLREDTEPLTASFQTLVAIDALASIAQFADKFGLEQCTVSETDSLKLIEASHPQLLILKQKGGLQKVEPLDLEIGKEQTVMVITGPNAGGKTIALKTAGILTVMALCGIPLPANGARSTFPLVDTILVDIGDDQSIEQSLSTFSAHVGRVATILNQAGKKSLVLLDELGAGTEPHQGAAIACSVLNELKKCGALVIATTHLSEIIGFVHRSEGMINAGMEYDAASYTPLYRLINGEPGHSHAIDIAVRFGMPKHIIDYARELLGSSGEEFTALLAELHRKRRELKEAQREIEREKESLSLIRQELEERGKAVEEARREARQKGLQDAKELLASSRREMNELLEEYKREHKVETAERFRKVQHQLSEEAASNMELKSFYKPVTSVKAGDKVFIRALNSLGTIIQQSEKQGKIRVRAGRMELDLTISELSAPPEKSTTGKKRSTPEEKANKTGWQLESTETEEREIKLIGMRVDEALEKLEPFLNQATLSGIKEVRIIHGFGTGRLRDAVREFIKRHPLVESCRPGDMYEGRDGATVVELLPT